MHVAILLDKSLVPAITLQIALHDYLDLLAQKTPDICEIFLQPHKIKYTCLLKYAYIYLHFLKNSHFNLTQCVNFNMKLPNKTAFL